MGLNVAMIVAAGRGSRAGGRVPKQYGIIAGKTVLYHTVMAFRNHPNIDEVQVVIHPEDKALYKQATAEITGILPPVMGGAERQDSVRLGLENLQGMAVDKVLIHDAARPLVTAEIVTEVLNNIVQGAAVIPAVAVEDSLRRSEGGASLSVDRNGLYRVQTPQGFIFDEIIALHQSMEDAVVTDDASLYELAGKQVRLVEGAQRNFKITTQDDFSRAENMMAISYETLIGTGFDVHKFDETEQDTFIMLGGIKVPHNFAILAHSDGDVVLHALVDAMLGAVAKGDIGEHFPPSDDKWKGKDSIAFVEHALKLVQEEGATLSNVDITIICERPKIRPHVDAMRQKIADILQMSVKRVSVKATTTEKLGFTGRKEGIAVQVSVSVCVAV